MATIRDLIKQFTKGSKNTYNKVLDTEVSDIANTSKKVSKGILKVELPLSEIHSVII